MRRPVDRFQGEETGAAFLLHAGRYSKASFMSRILDVKVDLHKRPRYLRLMFGTAAMAVKFRLATLLEERKKEGKPLTMSELARRSGVTFVTINAIAKNRTRQVHLDTIDKLCQALGVEPGALFEQKRGKG